MIERKVLYYPTIIVPSEWLKWAILYWDKASSIIPLQWTRERPQFKDKFEEHNYENMHYLMQEGLFEATIPDIGHTDTTKLRTSFRKLLIELEEVVKSKNFLKTVEKDWKKQASYRIHFGKMSEDIVRFLESTGLATKKGGGESELFDWFFVEKHVYYLYMALLAKNLAETNGDDTVASTDRSEYEGIVFGSGSKNDGFVSLRANFLDILPAPRADAAIREVVKFRKENEGKLLEFREVMDLFQGEIANAMNQVEINKIAVQYKERIERERTKLKDSLRDANIKTASSLVSSLVNIKSPALIGALGLSIVNAPLSVTIPIVVGTASIQIVSALVNNRNAQLAKLRESAFSYLYCAGQEKII